MAGNVEMQGVEWEERRGSDVIVLYDECLRGLMRWVGELSLTISISLSWVMKVV